MSEEETLILNLFESFWFEHGVFTSKPPFSTPKSSPVFQDQEPVTDDKPKLNRDQTLMRKSYSDQFLSSKDSPTSDTDTPSPKSVLGPQLQTILSGKEVESFDGSSPKLLDDIGITDICPKTEDLKPDRKRKRRVRRRSTGSRSMSELEIQELKGFMDLGFVFSDEDKDSRLVSIIPGLQRFGKNVQDSDKSSSVSRPYLSEAWDCLGDEIRMDLRIPSFGNEMELKDHLRCWAHNVASTVR
ncbi:hypothetical protein ACS0TY_032533 [Phlomoides rotata]